MASQTSGRNSVGVDTATGTPSTAGRRRVPTGPVPADIQSLNATWTRLQFVTQQCASFQKESYDIQGFLWTNIHTMLHQRNALEKSLWDIHTAYGSKIEQLNELAETNVLLQEELKIAEEQAGATRRMAEDAGGRCRNLVEQQTFLQRDLNQARERIHALENDVAVRERTIDNVDHPQDATVHELDSSENAAAVRILELQARIKELEQEHEHMVEDHKDIMSRLEARLLEADQKLKQIEQTTDRTRSTDLVISPAVKREPLSSPGNDGNTRVEDNEIIGRGGRKKPKRARKGPKLEPLNSELKVECQ